MADQTINIQVTGDASGVASAMKTAADSVQQFVTATAPIAPALDASADAGAAFSGTIAQLLGVVQGLQTDDAAAADGLHELQSALEGASTAGEHTSDTLHRVERSAEMREASQAIREGIENPLGAASKAAESFLLSFGTAGLIATGILAIGGAALEAANHVGELAHEYEKLSGMLGIGIEPAEHLARTFDLMGLEEGSLVMASRTLSRVLDETTPAGVKLREQVEGLGVKLRDSSSAFRSFDELLPDIITRLQTMTTVVERNHLATQLFGRSALQLLSFDWSKFSKLAEGGLTDTAVERAGQYHIAWEVIKQSIGDATNALGDFAIKAALLPTLKAVNPELYEKTVPKEKPTLGVPGALEEGKQDGSAYAGGFATGIGLNTTAVTAAIEATKKQKTLGVDAAQLAVIESNNKRIAEGMKAAFSDPAERAKEELKELQEQLGKLAGGSIKDTSVTASILTQIEAKKAYIETLKAEGERLKLNEGIITGQKVTAVAAIELQKKSIEDQISLEKQEAEFRLKMGVQGAPLPAAPSSIAAAQPFTISEDPTLSLAAQHRSAVVQLALQERDAVIDAAQQTLAAETASIQARTALQQAELAKAPNQEKRVAAQVAIQKLAQEQEAADNKVAATSQAANDKATLAIQAADNTLAEERKKNADKWISLQEESATLTTTLSEETQKKVTDRVRQVADENAKAENKKQQDVIETEIQVLRSNERMRLAEAVNAGAGFRERIALTEKYESEIAKAIEALNKLKVAEATAKDARENEKFNREVGGAASASIPGGAPLPGTQTTAAQTAAEAAAAKTAQQQLDATAQKLDELKRAQDRADFTLYFAKMNQGLSQAINSWVTGTATFGQAFTRMAGTMVSGWINSLAMMGVQWIEHHALLQAIQAAWEHVATALHIQTAAAKAATDLTAQAQQASISSFYLTRATVTETTITSLHAAQNEARVASDVAMQTQSTAALIAGNAAAAPVRVAEVTGAAAVGAANAEAATAAIPIVGPELAPGVGATTFAEIMGWTGPAAFEQGGLVGSAPMMAVLHPKEMVLPAPISEMVQRMAGAGPDASSYVETGGSNRMTELRKNLASLGTSAVPSLDATPAFKSQIQRTIEQTTRIPGFEAGGLVGGKETLALLHPQEMVLPAHISQGVQSMMAGTGNPSNSTASGGDTHFHFNPTVSSLDDTGMDAVLSKHQRLFIRAVNGWRRSGHLQ